MAYAISLGIGLFVLWFALSGYTLPLILSFGVFSCILCVWLAARMNLMDDEAVPIRLRFSLTSYWGWLAREIVKANWAVTKIILSPHLAKNMQQQLIEVPTTQKTDMGRVIFANSITLTPGTVTVATEKNKFTVLALADQFTAPEGLAEMDRRVTKVETRA